MARSTYKNQGLSQLRGRWHDLNSQRRYRGQSTVGWAEYRKKTKNGKVDYAKK